MAVNKRSHGQSTSGS